MRFYRAPNKRLIARGRNGQFSKTTLADIGMGCCEKCGTIYSVEECMQARGFDGPMVDPRKYNLAKRFCKDHCEATSHE